jgi:D-tyrosyl-tRNA(Tyr) deacylase
MRAVVQRVRGASVSVGNAVVASIDTGLLVLVGVVPSDGDVDAEALARKLASLRIFPDPDDKMNRAVCDVGGSILVVSQFTLAADVRKGRRPSFADAAHPDHAAAVIDRLVGSLIDEGVPVETGRFGAMMDVSLTNWGPVTFVVDVHDGAVAANLDW